MFLKSHKHNHENFRELGEGSRNTRLFQIVYPLLCLFSQTSCISCFWAREISTASRKKIFLFIVIVVQLLSSFKYIALLLTKLRTQSPLINGWVKPWQRWFWSRLLARCAKEMLLENWLCFTTSEEQLRSYAKKSQSSLELTNLILTRLLNIPKSNH